MKAIEYWKNTLDLHEWCIESERIPRKAVVYSEEVPPEDRYFVGIEINRENKTATIYHDRFLTEEAVIHELLHVRYPKEDEDWINETTKQYIHSKYKY